MDLVVKTIEKKKQIKEKPTCESNISTKISREKIEKNMEWYYQEWIENQFNVVKQITGNTGGWAKFI